MDTPEYQGPEPKFHDLDFLIGSWTKEESDEFDRCRYSSRAQDIEMKRLEWRIPPELDGKQ